MFKQFLSRHWVGITSFLLPVVIMTCYFAYRNMAPFGDQSILTVDMGQQYVDFFAYFKHAVTQDPSSFFYSFSKALGGEMTGLWAYYLMSPVNLLLLLFPLKYLASAILLMTVVKYGLVGFGFSWLLKRHPRIDPRFIPIWATVYALNGWIIANQLNLIWLDAMALLPMIVAGIEALVDNHSGRFYCFSLAAMLIINYYMAYMLAIFAVCYFAYYQVSRWTTTRQAVSNGGRFAGSSLAAGGLAAFILLPTYHALLTSKAAYTLNGVKAQFEYAPLKMLAKFYNGGFNFDQMPAGTPNIFVGSLAIVAFLGFFCIKRFPIRQRIAAGALTTFLVLSMCFKPLDLFWHAMQFPIWYPYRFSFIFCFWLIYLGAQALPDWDQVSQVAKVVIIAIVSAGCGYVLFNIKQFQNFLTVENATIGTILMVAAVALLMLTNSRVRLFYWAFVILAIGEMGFNVFSSLNNISYVTNSNYVGYTQNLKRAVSRVQSRDDGFYRIAKTFYRTKDDPFEASYNGGDHFSSTFEKAMPQFMERIGQPDGDGFTEYSNGTLLTDSLLSMKYVFNANNPTSDQYLMQLTDKPDVNNYRKQSEIDHVQTYQNQFSLPIGFASSQQIFTKNNGDDPMDYQSALWNDLLGQSKHTKWFSAVNFDHSKFVNIPKQSNLTGAFLQKQKLLQPANMLLTFTPKTNNSYYLTLGSAINLGSTADSQNAKIYKNGRLITQYSTYRNTVIVNVASKDRGKPVTINVELTKSSLLLQNFTLYQLDNHRFAQAAQKLQQHPLKLSHYNSRSFSGTITIGKHQSALATTIPDATGWHLTVNGQPHRIIRWSDMFIGAKLKPGTYRIRLSYWPPLLTPGLIITAGTIIAIGGTMIIRKKRH